MKVKVRIGKDPQESGNMYICYAPVFDMFVTSDTRKEAITDLISEVNHMKVYCESVHRAFSSLAGLRYELRVKFRQILQEELIIEI